MKNQWTDARRERQREVINVHKPWLKSTGPRTTEGKAKVSRNAYNGGLWLKLRELSVKTTQIIKDLKAQGQWPP